MRQYMCALIVTFAYLRGVTCNVPKTDKSALAKGVEEPTAFKTALDVVYRYQDVLLENLGMVREAEDYSAEPRESCAACMSVVSLLSQAVTEGTYNGTREMALTACGLWCQEDNYDADALCPGIVDTYQPHVWYVFNQTTKSSRDICTEVNICAAPPSYCEPPPIPESRFQSQQLPLPRSNPKPRDLVGAIKFLHVTDPHIDIEYDLTSPVQCDLPACCRNTDHGNGSARVYGEYDCDVPLLTVDRLLAAFTDTPLDGVLYTGDAPPHRVWADTHASVMAHSSTMQTTVARNLPGVPAFQAIGNHDMHPCNLYYYRRPETQQIKEEIYAQWAAVGGLGPEQQTTFEHGGYYSVLLRPGLRLLAYNSMFSEEENFYNILSEDQPDFADMQQFMEDTMAAAVIAGEKVIMIGHHPTGTQSIYNRYACFLTDIQARYGDTVVIHLLGHKHDELWYLVRDLTSGATRGVQMCPAAASTTNNNPVVKVIYLDSTTFELLEIDTYYMDIAKAYAQQTLPEVELMYRFTEEYEMVDLSPTSFEDLVIRMHLDPTLMDKYLLNEVTRNPDALDPCDASCRDKNLCKIQNTVYTAYDTCRGG